MPLFRQAKRHARQVRLATCNAYERTRGYYWSREVRRRFKADARVGCGHLAESDLREKTILG